MWRVVGMTLALWLLGAAALRVTLLAPEVCPTPRTVDLDAGAAAAASWLERALQPDDRFVYEFNRDTGVVSNDYNVVRHAGVTMSLYQYAALGHPEVLDSADRGLAFMLANLQTAGPGSAFVAPGDARAQLGASALLLAGLAQRRLATGDARYDSLMAGVGRFLVAMQQADGSFLADWNLAAGRPVPEVRSRYATGEAFWALTLMHGAFPGGGWQAPARSVAHYLATERDEREAMKFPPWADQWAAYGLSEMADWPLSEDEADYASRLAERFGFLIRAEARRDGSTFSKLTRGPDSRAAGLGTWVEALTSLALLSQSDRRLQPLHEDIAARARCGAALLLERQQEARPGTPGPDLVGGAWFERGVTRMDDQQHALSGLARTRALLEGGRP